MSNVNSLILPSTIPETTHIRQLLLFSDRVFQFAPSEDSVDTEAISAFNDLYNHYPPAPFGEGLETFHRFIKDLTSYRAEYYSGALSNLSNSLSTDIDESSVWQLINKLAEETSSQPQADKLMHARLLMTLAELHHKEDIEINAALVSIDTQAHTVFSELKDETDETIAELSFAEAQTNKRNPLHMLKAWFHLFLADTTTTVFPIIATDKETLSTLIEYTSNLIAPQQNTICTLATPAQHFFESDETFSEGLKEFRQTRQTEIKQLQAALLKATNSSTGISEAGEYNSAVETHFGAPQGAPMSLYRLPISLPELAAKVTNSTAPEANNYPANTIIAVLS